MIDQSVLFCMIYNIIQRRTQLFMLTSYKKLWWLWFVAVMVVSGCVQTHSSPPPSLTLTPIVTSGSFSPVKGFNDFGMSYVNDQGERLEQEYMVAMPFSEGLAFTISKSGETGFIDSTGQLILDLSSMEWNPGAVLAGTFSEGLVLVLSDGNKAGYMDREGNLVIDFQYDWALNFSEGLAGVQMNDKMGYIDKNGQVVIDMNFDEVSDFSDGIALVRTGDEYYAIDQNGEILFQMPGTPVSGKYDEGLLPIRIGELAGYVDNEGKLAIDAQFDSAFRFQEGVAAVKQGNKWGYINRDGEMVIDARFEFAYHFLNGRAFVQDGGKWGIINTKGEYIEEPHYDQVNSIIPEMLMLMYIRDDYSPFSKRQEGFVAQLTKGEDTYYVHKDGRIVQAQTER